MKQLIVKCWDGNPQSRPSLFQSSFSLFLLIHCISFITYDGSTGFEFVVKEMENIK